MQFKNPLLVTADIEASKEFYRRVLGLEVILDFGANVTLTGGVCLQTNKSWCGFIGASADDIICGGNDAELYFEEEQFDEFIENLSAIPDINYVHPVITHRWGQRAVRFYDPDMHIIEVGESMRTVCRRFLNSGMTVEETAERMDVPAEYVNSCAV